MHQFISLLNLRLLNKAPSASLNRGKGKTEVVVKGKCRELNKDHWWGSEYKSEREQRGRCWAIANPRDWQSLVYCSLCLNFHLLEQLRTAESEIFFRRRFRIKVQKAVPLPWKTFTIESHHVMVTVRTQELKDSTWWRSHSLEVPPIDQMLIY